MTVSLSCHCHNMDTTFLLSLAVFVNYVSITILEEVGSAIIRAQLVDVTTGQSGCLIEKDVQVSYDTFPGDAVGECSQLHVLTTPG